MVQGGRGDEFRSKLVKSTVVEKKKGRGSLSKVIAHTLQSWGDLTIPAKVPYLFKKITASRYSEKIRKKNKLKRKLQKGDGERIYWTSRVADLFFDAVSNW